MARRRKGDLTHVGRIARGVLGEGVWQRAEAQAVLERAWREVVGDFVARHSQVVGIKGTSLVVRVDDHSLMNNLQLMAPGILKRLNEQAKSKMRPLKKLVMRWGEIERKNVDELVEGSLPELAPEQRARVEEVLKEIKDPELREITERLMVRAMAKAR